MKSSIILTLRILIYNLHVRFQIELKIDASPTEWLVHYSVDEVYNPSNTENSDILFA